MLTSHVFPMTDFEVEQIEQHRRVSRAQEHKLNMVMDQNTVLLYSTVLSLELMIQYSVHIRLVEAIIFWHSV